MEGLKVRIKGYDYECIGECEGKWTFAPLNQDVEEIVILNDLEISALKAISAFTPIEEESIA